MENRRDSEDFKYRKNLNDREVRKASKHRKPIELQFEDDVEESDSVAFDNWWDDNEAN